LPTIDLQIRAIGQGAVGNDVELVDAGESRRQAGRGTLAAVAVSEASCEPKMVAQVPGARLPLYDAPFVTPAMVGCACDKAAASAVNRKIPRMVWGTATPT
jgi:hypothetical protein